MSKVLSAIYGAHWAILPEKLHLICLVAERWESKVPVTAEEIAAASGTRKRAYMSVRGNTAIIQVSGTIANRMGLLENSSGGASAEKIGQDFDAALNNPDIGAIVLDIDSPGGTVAGTPELADKIFNARGRKPIVAVANAMAASAAYWIGSAAEQFVVTPSGEVGSIGVVAMHSDYSEADKAIGVKRTIVSSGKYKTEGNPYEPLSDDAKAEIQRRVDSLYQSFVSTVAKHRGTTKSAVMDDMGGGRMLPAQEALKAGMVDRIATMDTVLSELTAGRPASVARARQRMAGF